MQEFCEKKQILRERFQITSRKIEIELPCHRVIKQNFVFLSLGRSRKNIAFLVLR